MNVIDISVYQGTNIDFAKVKAAGVKAVIIKAGEGKQIYDSFAPQAKGAIAQKLPIGVYWFSRAYTTDMAKEEAKKCVEAIKGYDVDLPLFIDFEYDSVTTMTRAGVTPNMTLITNIHYVFCKTVEELGYKAGYYTNPDFLSRYVNASKLTAFYKWVACWGTNPYSSCDLWQSGYGLLNGINGYVDYDQIISSRFAELVDNATKPEEKKETKTAEQIAIEVIQGKWGVYPARMQRIKAAGYDYNEIQKIVDEIMTGKRKITTSSSSTSSSTKKSTKTTKETTKKTDAEIAAEVVQGKWGAGATRKKKLTAAGYDYAVIQKLVDELMKK